MAACTLHVYIGMYSSMSYKNKAEECNEVAGLKPTTSQQTIIHNLFAKINYTTFALSWSLKKRL